MHVERRRKRSSYSSLALQYWLSSIASQQEVFALILADAAGLLVASSLRGPEAEELAAVAPLLARPDDSGLNVAERGDVPVVIHKVLFDQSSFFLCAVGDRGRSRRSVRLAEGGVRRILDEPAVAAS
jgi:hypothetical protein